LTQKDAPTLILLMRKGFGSRLIERALAMELGGGIRINYERSGVVCTIDARLPTPKSELKCVLTGIMTRGVYIC
jgi:hypothetical protein